MSPAAARISVTCAVDREVIFSTPIAMTMSLIPLATSPPRMVKERRPSRRARILNPRRRNSRHPQRGRYIRCQMILPRKRRPGKVPEVERLHLRRPNRAIPEALLPGLYCKRAKVTIRECLERLFLLMPMRLATSLGAFSDIRDYHGGIFHTGPGTCPARTHPGPPERIKAGRQQALLNKAKTSTGEVQKLDAVLHAKIHLVLSQPGWIKHGGSACGLYAFCKGGGGCRRYDDARRRYRVCSSPATLWGMKDTLLEYGAAAIEDLIKEGGTRVVTGTVEHFGTVPETTLTTETKKRKSSIRDGCQGTVRVHGSTGGAHSAV